MERPLRGAGRRRFAFAGALVLLGLAGPAAAQPLEYAAKAQYLYKFAPFVEWPAEAFASATSPFNVCVLGDAPFGETLETATRDQRVYERRVAVHKLQSVKADTSCHVLYVGRSRTQSAADALRVVRGRPVLTVTDASQGVRGGVVHFLLRRGRVKFAIDLDRARNQGLVVSSKLLGLAVDAPRGGA